MPPATTAAVYDARDDIFAEIRDHWFRAVITAERHGVLAGCKFARQHADELGVTVEFDLNDGDELAPGVRVLTATGTPKALAMAEERLLGCLCKSSGIATASRRAATLAAGKVKIVSGAWKKVDPALKWQVRMAIAAGGLDSRIVDEPFLYLDKNYVRMLGGVAETLRAVQGLEGVRVIQIKGETAPIAEEVEIACANGAGIVMVDSGRLSDAETAVQLVSGSYPNVKVAFAGGIKLADIPGLLDRGIAILDIGVEIVDAPLIDMKFDVLTGGDNHGV
jgi:nicotinate-nucleotide pyrophosphorylase (carboxylating)